MKVGFAKQYGADAPMQGALVCAFQMMFIGNLADNDGWDSVQIADKVPAGFVRSVDALNKLLRRGQIDSDHHVKMFDL